MTGRNQPAEISRRQLIEKLNEALEDSVRYRSSSGFLLIAIDCLARVEEAHGFDVADEIIAAVAQRVRARMRNGDSLGRFSGNILGLILRNCTPEHMAAAAGRLITELREEAVQTSVACFPVTATIGGVTAPRHARTAGEAVARAQQALDAAKAKPGDAFCAYVPVPEAARFSAA